MPERLAIRSASIAALASAGACALAAPAAAPARSADVRAHSSATVSLSADSSGALKFRPARLRAKRGSITIRMKNPAPFPHGIAIAGRAGRIVGTGGTSTLTVTLRKGRYPFFCAVTAHKAAGMRGMLTVWHPQADPRVLGAARVRRARLP